MSTPANPVATPNAEMTRYWNEVSGPKWVALQEGIDRQIEPIGAAVIERAALRPGENVLDVGCGCGATSLAAARAVAPGGEVRGLDLSAPMLARAAERAREEGLRNLCFERGDAQTVTLPQRFDVLLSRFGVMFFDAPEAAFANLRRALRPGGRVAFACWQAIGRNPWMTVPVGAVAKVVSLPPPPAPDAPGPFAFADDARVRRILDAAGFTDVALESFERELAIGPGDLDGAVHMMLSMGPAATALREAPDGAAKEAEVAAAVREALAPYLRSDGVRMASASWIVTARNPG